MRSYIRLYCNGEKIRSIGVNNWTFNYWMDQTSISKKNKYKLKPLLTLLLHHTYFHIKKPSCVFDKECCVTGITYEGEYVFDVEFVKCNRSGTKRTVEKRHEIPYCILKYHDTYALAYKGYTYGDELLLECHVREKLNFDIIW